MNSKPIADAEDADLTGSLAAIERAAQRAREQAARTGTDLIVERDGRIVRVPVPSVRQPD